LQHPSEKGGFSYNLWAMQADQSKRTSRWMAYRRWIQIILLATVAAWWAFWDFDHWSGIYFKD
jgi:hypothetical protein